MAGKTRELVVGLHTVRSSFIASHPSSLYLRHALRTSAVSCCARAHVLAWFIVQIRHVLLVFGACYNIGGKHFFGEKKNNFLDDEALLKPKSSE